RARVGTHLDGWFQGGRWSLAAPVAADPQGDAGRWRSAWERRSGRCLARSDPARHGRVSRVARSDGAWHLTTLPTPSRRPCRAMSEGARHVLAAGRGRSTPSAGPRRARHHPTVRATPPRTTTDVPRLRVRPLGTNRLAVEPVVG